MVPVTEHLARTSDQLSRFGGKFAVIAYSRLSIQLDCIVLQDSRATEVLVLLGRRLENIRALLAIMKSYRLNFSELEALLKTLKPGATAIHIEHWSLAESPPEKGDQWVKEVVLPALNYE